MATSRYIKQVNKTDNNWLLPLLVVLFSGLGIAFSIGGYTAGRYFTILLVGVSLLLNVEDLLCFIMFCFPFSSMLKLSAATISIIPFLYLVFIIKVLLKGKLSFPHQSVLCFLLFAVLQMLSIAIYNAAATDILSMLLNVGFVLFVSYYTINHQEAINNLLPKASLHFAVGTCIMLLLSDIFPHLPRLVNATKVDAIESINRYAATVVDPNELAQIILISIGLLIAIMPSFKHTVMNVLAVIMIAYLAITGIRTGSKSYAITLMAIFMLLIVVYVRITARRFGAAKALIRIFPILLIATVGTVLILSNVIIPIFTSRAEDQTNFWNGRNNIWADYLQALFRRLDVLLIGCGASNVTTLMELAGAGPRSGVPHNAYLEYLIQFGVLGLTVLGFALKSVWGAIKKKINTYYIIALMAFVITAFGISINANDCPFILLALLSLPLPEKTLAIAQQKPEKTGAPLGKYLKTAKTRP